MKIKKIKKKIAKLKKKLARAKLRKYGLRILYGFTSEPGC